MIEVLKGYLDTDWRTKDNILYFLKKVCDLKTNERTLRECFATFNEAYEKGETELFIAHSSKGYLLTTNPDIILESLKDDYKKGLSLMKRYYRCKKSLAEKKQIALLPKKEADLYEVIMSLED